MSRGGDPAAAATRRALAVFKAALGPVLTLRGFAAGAAGTGPAGSGQLLFCAPTTDLLASWPWLPTGFDGPAPDGACVDVVVDVDAGMLSAVRVETAQLAGLLRTQRHAGQASLVQGAIGRDSARAAPVLAAALEVLLPIEAQIG